MTVTASVGHGLVAITQTHSATGWQKRTIASNLTKNTSMRSSNIGGSIAALTMVLLSTMWAADCHLEMT